MFLRFQKHLPANNVAGAVLRKRNMVASVIEGIDSQSLVGFVHESVSDKVSLVCSVAWRGYSKLKRKFPRGVIDHHAGKYVVGAIRTNTIEGF